MARSAWKGSFLFALLSAFAFSIAGAAQEPQQQQPQVKIDWQDGPTTGQLGDIAQVKIPAGYRFTGKQGALRVMELTQNPASGRELGVVIPSGGNARWFMTFEFEDLGYVKDDEKDKLDNDAILKSIKDGTEASNDERRKHGWPAYHVVGWQTAPFYDPLTHNLTWAIDGKGDGADSHQNVNHSVRLLGRGGTMNVDLVVSTEDYAASITQFNAVINGFSYVQGQRYADFRAGTK